MVENLIETRELRINGTKVRGLKVDLHGTPLLLMVAPKGYIMCGYLNLETAEKLGQAAAIVKGVKSFDDVLNAKIVQITSGARKLGVLEGMSGREALKLMS